MQILEAEKELGSYSAKATFEVKRKISKPL